MYIGDTQIYKMFFGDNEIFKGYIGDTEVFGASGPGPQPAPENNWVQFYHRDTGSTKNFSISLRWTGNYDSMPVALEYCISDTEPDENTVWTQWTSTGETQYTFGSIGREASLYVRSGEYANTRFSYDESNYWRFNFAAGTNPLDIYGNLSALFDKDVHPDDFAFEEDYACNHLFANTGSTSASRLVDVSNLVLPLDSNSLGREGTYAYLFYGQSKITAIPNVFRIEQSGFDYGKKVFEGMFQGCNNLPYDAYPENIYAHNVGQEAFAYMYYAQNSDNTFRTLNINITGYADLAAFDYMFAGSAVHFEPTIQLNPDVFIDDVIVFRGMFANCPNVSYITFITNGAGSFPSNSFKDFLPSSVYGILNTDDVDWWSEVEADGYLYNWTIQSI